MERWPHVKRNWINAIKAIRIGGGISKQLYLNAGGYPFKEGYIWWNIRADMVPCRNVGGMLRTSTCHKKTTKEEPPVFSNSSSSDRLTEEQENEIAENIFDWWISGKPYKQWYVEKFCQLKFDFKDEE